MSDKESKKIKSWYSNRYQIVLVQRNVLLLITIVAMVAVSGSIFFVKNIMSSKSLEPYVIQIDEKTGMPTVVEQINSSNFSGNEVMMRYFINRYVMKSAGYNSLSYRNDIDEIRLMSTPKIYKDFRARIDSSTLGSEGSIEVKIKAIVFKKNNDVEIRISRKFNTPNTPSQTEKNEIIFMNCYFAPQITLSVEERMINPLGFQVAKFDIGEELY